MPRIRCEHIPVMRFQPLQYRNMWVRILCHDCNVESDTLFHVMGLKCRHSGCGSYNTARIGPPKDEHAFIPEPSSSPPTTTDDAAPGAVPRMSRIDMARVAASVAAMEGMHVPGAVEALVNAMMAAAGDDGDDNDDEEDDDDEEEEEGSDDADDERPVDASDGDDDDVFGDSTTRQ